MIMSMEMLHCKDMDLLLAAGDSGQLEIFEIVKSSPLKHRSSLIRV